MQKGTFNEKNNNNLIIQPALCRLCVLMTVMTVSKRSEGAPFTCESRHTRAHFRAVAGHTEGPILEQGLAAYPVGGLRTGGLGYIEQGL